MIKPGEHLHEDALWYGKWVATHWEWRLRATLIYGYSFKFIKDIEACPKCEDRWCEGTHGDNMYSENKYCPTYYDGCHCCELCHGFPRCNHGKWATEECNEKDCYV